MGESNTSPVDQAFMLRFVFILLALLRPATAAPLLLAQGTTAARVEDAPAATLLGGYLLPAPGQPPEGMEKEAFAKTAPLATLRIDWLNQTPAPEEFEVAVTMERRIITSTLRLGKTGITRTILATPEAFFLHIVADQPGAIAFRTTLTSTREGKTTPSGRNELLWSSADYSPAKTYVRVIPFESDVEADGDAIVLRGEGECLVIFSLTGLDSAEKPLSGTWQRLAATLDPGEEHPDPSKIWQAILARATAP
ncbi:MAG: hypothetical protein EOP88_25255 [Verrucomicrobiaceae bacterium]|nr:MAG: hypothetical protein EOP88_25255 [Verrucomicrobiaceae bacterium]